MTQKIINVGTVANDGTGDTIRGAFTNVNANFTEVYNNVATLTAGLASIDSGQNTAIQSAYDTTNAAFAAANSVNTLAYNIGTSGNSYAVAVGAAGNAYTVTVGSSANAYTVSVSASINAYSLSVATAGNNYASVLVANNAVGANAWSNTVAVTTTDWANSKFTTLVNTATHFTTTNAAFLKANNALANSTGTFSGNLLVTGACSTTSFFDDSLGPVRERKTVTAVSNSVVEASQSVIIANNSNTIYIKIPNDNNFLLPANVGTTIEFYQYGSGETSIVANDAAVTIHSSNNWANIAGQYLSARAVKVKSNTWILTGNLKA